MPIDDLLSVAEAAEQLGLSPSSVKYAIRRGVLECVRAHARLNLIHRDEVERYRREHLGKRGRRKQPDDGLSDEQRRRRTYQREYRRRRRATTEQPAQ